MKQRWTITLTIQFGEPATEQEFREVFHTLSDTLRRQYGDGITSDETERWIEQIITKAETGEKELIPS